MIPDKVEKYLDKLSLKNWILEAENYSNITAAVVIPVIAEFDNLKNLLSSLITNSKESLASTIFIFVINNLTTSSSEIKTDNKKSLNMLRSIVKDKLECTDSFSRNIVSSGIRIGIIDAASEGNELSEKYGGVGLARKIGMDSVLHYFDYENCSKKIIISLDADCLVENNYLKEIINNFNLKKLHVATVNYEHIIKENEETAEAIICYELFLRYYVLGLKYAGSPYAFHAIGSTMVCDYESYINVEGMNKRKAGEDFYFLEKLSKNYLIENINTTTVFPSSRKSDRVPFGTGQRVGRFLLHNQNEYLLYNPKSFDVLKDWIRILDDELNESVMKYMSAAKEINIDLFNFLIENNIESDFKKILSNSISKKQLRLQKMRWFDGFKTLKLIHYLRDNSLPLMNMFDAIDKMLYNFGIEKVPNRMNTEVPSINIQMEYLTLLRKFY